MGGLLYTHALKYIRLRANENENFKRFLENIARKKTRVFYVPASGSFEIKHPEFKGFKKNVLPLLAAEKARELKKEGFTPRKVLVIDEAKSGSSLVGTLKVFENAIKKLAEEGFDTQLKSIVLREKPRGRTLLTREYVNLKKSGKVVEILASKVVTMDNVFFPITFKPVIVRDSQGINRLVGVERKPRGEREPYNLFTKTLEKYFTGKNYSNDFQRLTNLLAGLRKAARKKRFERLASV